VSVTDIFGGGACVCVNTGSSPKMEQAQTCPSPPDVVAVMTQSLMTQQPASPPDFYRIAVMTKSSSTGQISHDKFYYGQIVLQLGKRIARVRLYARQKFPGFERGSGYSSIYHKRTSFWGRSLCLCQPCVNTGSSPKSFWGRSLCLSRTFWGRSLCLSRTFGGGAYSCRNANAVIGQSQITTRCL
jgi:hypothetical protein